MEVMDVLWRKGEATIRDVFSELSKKRKLAYKTVATLLTRLRTKGYVEAEERNFAYVFRPLAEREPVVLRKVDDLVNRSLGGDLGALTLYMARHGNDLTDDQIETLEEIIRSARGKDGN
jgi:predicted transcriptional regulator